MVNLIEEWGKWSRHQGYERHSTPLFALMRENGCFERGDVSAPNITDDEAMAVDKAMNLLRKEFKVLYDILFLKYVKGQSLRDIARYYMTPLEYPEQIGMNWNNPKKKKIHHSMVDRMAEQAEKIVYKNLDFCDSRG